MTNLPEPLFERAMAACEHLVGLHLIDRDRALDDARRLFFAEHYGYGGPVDPSPAGQAVAAELAGLSCEEAAVVIGAARLGTWRAMRAELDRREAAGEAAGDGGDTEPPAQLH